MKTLQDSRLDHVRPGEHPAHYYLLDAITQLDPANTEAYLHGSCVLSVVRIDRDGARALVQRAEAFIERDLPTMPERFQRTYWTYPWDIYLLRAYLELFDFHDFAAATRAFGKAAQFPGAPPYLRSLVAKLNDEERRYPLAQDVLARQLQSVAKDATARAELERKLQDLKVSEFLYHAQRAYQAARDGARGNLTWEQFTRREPQWTRDPLGGNVSLPPGSEQLTTTTPYKEPF
jgi:hypothetical protein